MSDNRNTILAVILSGLVLLGWQYFFNIPQMEKQRAAERAQSQLVTPTPQPVNPAATPSQPGAAPAPSGGAPATSSAAPVVSRDAALAAGPRIKIDTPRLSGSIGLKGARIDDLALVQFRETVDPASPPHVLCSPSTTADPHYAESGRRPAT